MSNIVPNQETGELPVASVDNNISNTMPAPANTMEDFGKTILPSENLAKAQNMIDTARPMTNRTPLLASTGIFVNGKKKSGNNTTTKNKDTNEILSNMFERIGYIILYVNN